MAGFLKNLFGTADESEGFRDYDSEGYDISSSAVTNEEAAYSSDADSYTSSSASVSASNTMSSSKYINMHNSGDNKFKFAILKPASYEEIMKDGVEMLRNGTLIFLNLSDVDQRNREKIIDFMVGVAAALDGKMRQVGTTFCYAVAPKNVDWVSDIGDDTFYF